MIPSPAKCRSRIRAIRAWIAACPPDKPGEKGSNRKLLLYGVVPAGYDLGGWMKDDLNTDEGEPLDLVESMTFDTWFYQHPGKMCGKEVLTTSREFPLTIKGTREDCERVFEKHFGPLKTRPATQGGTPAKGGEQQPEMDWRKLNRDELMKRAELWVEVWGSYPSFLTQHYQILAKYDNGFVSTIVKANKKTARKLAGMIWDELQSSKEQEATAALALMQMLELEMEAGLSGASNGTTTYYQINDTLATICAERKNGQRLYRVETFRAWMPPFLLNCELPNTNTAWFPTVRQCKRHVDEIDVLNYYAFSEESAKADARAWLRTHPHRAEGIFELEQ